jgi:hypothetical protein
MPAAACPGTVQRYENLPFFLNVTTSPRRLAGLDLRRGLPADPEVVRDMADVLEDERDLAGLPNRLGRELEEELAALDLDRCRGRTRLPVSACRGERDEHGGGDHERREREDRAGTPRGPGQQRHRFCTSFFEGRYVQ